MLSYMGKNKPTALIPCSLVSFWYRFRCWLFAKERGRTIFVPQIVEVQATTLETDNHITFPVRDGSTSKQAHVNGEIS